MNLDLDKSTWKRVRLGDVVHRSREQVDPLEAGVDRYVAGGHIDSHSIMIQRWGRPDDGQMGSTFRYTFRPGHTLFVSARPYLRKTGVVDFSGVVADKTYVLNAAIENGLLQDFLPFILSSDQFIAYANAEATGSMNPRLLWGPMQRYELDLPPLDKQQRIADLLWSIEHHLERVADVIRTTLSAREVVLARRFSNTGKTVRLGECATVTSGVTLGPDRRGMSKTAPYLRVANVQRGGLDLSEIKEVGASEQELETKAVVRDDVLVVEGHASVAEIGRAAIWNRNDQPLFQNHLFRVRAHPPHRPRFLLEWINGEPGRTYIRTVAKSTSGLSTINSTALKAMEIPSVALDVQDSLLRQLDHIDAAIAASSHEIVIGRALQSSLISVFFGGGE